jgi:hypothetical protein
MRRSLVVAVVFAIAVAATQITIGQVPGQPRLLAPDANEFELPPDYPPDPPAWDEPEPLPAPTLREPFAIGEALHDPTRVPDAVVSLLALMNIGIVAEGQAMRPVQGAMRLRLTEAEVRGLIDMGVADATNAGSDNPPPDSTYTFSDLHEAVAPLLRTPMTVAEMAERYAEAYQNPAESLVPGVLLGAPIEPETSLLRTQIWLMIADAFGPSPTGRVARSAGPRVVFARAVLQQGGSQSWGNGFRPGSMAPNAPLSDAEWRELVVRLPLLANQSVIRVTPSGPRAHEGHGGPGTPQVFNATFVPPPVVSAITGRPLLQPRPGGAANLRLSWDYLGDLESHGAFNVPEATPTAAGPGGSWSTTFTPRAELTRTPRDPVSEASGFVLASIPATDLLRALYVVPNQLLTLALGTGHVAGMAAMTVAWHPGDGISIRIRNRYDIPNITGLPGLEVTRDGNDYAVGTLIRDDDGRWRGEVVLSSKSKVTLPGKECSAARWVHQRAAVVGTEIEETGDPLGAFYHNLSRRSDYTWIEGRPAEYLRLEFTPITRPRWIGDKGVKDPCLDELGGDAVHRGPVKYIPLNDARWTTPGTGVGLAIPSKTDGFNRLRYRQLGDAFAYWSITVTRQE